MPSVSDRNALKLHQEVPEDGETVYSQIKIGTPSIGYVCMPTEADRREVLELLNSHSFAQRSKPNLDQVDLIHRTQGILTDQAIKHRENGLLSEEGTILYPWNCHGIARIMCELDPHLTVVNGYLININAPRELANLASHAVVRDSEGVLVDALAMDGVALGYPLTSYYYIVHTSGRCAVNLLVAG